MTGSIPQPDADGRIPFTLRIGVTGHRKFENPASVTRITLEALGQIKTMVPALPEAGLEIVVISALAEGADRLVAELILAEPGSRLEAALPLPASEYVSDFEDAESKQQFEDLLGRASRTWIAPQAASREEAYERAGCYVVDRSDVMIALWDGEPARGRGGTAAIVAYTRDRKVPLVWVQTSGEPTVVDELHGPRADVIRAAARQLTEYDLGSIAPATFQAKVGEELDRLRPEVREGAGIDPLGVSVENVAPWLIPYFVRADVLALRQQRLFRLLSMAMFGMAAAAVTVVAIQANFLPELNWLAIFEILALLCLLAIPLLNRRWRLHDRWISYRYLAERLRSLYFLTLAGTGDRGRQAARLAYISDPSEVWIERALAEVLTRRPETGAAPDDFRPLRRYLSHYWIGGQITYQKKAARTQRRWDDRLTRATVILFLLTLVAALLHVAGVGERGTLKSHWAVLLIVVSISVPAIGAAVHGIGTQRQYRRHADRYYRMASLLTRLQEDMDRAASLDDVRDLAVETERIMREENGDWFGVMRFHDMELIT